MTEPLRAEVERIVGNGESWAREYGYKALRAALAATPPALDRETREYLHDMATRHSVFDPSDGNYRVETGTWNVILRALSTGDET